MYFSIVQINIFRGDLSDISAKTATLFTSVSFLAELLVRSPRKLIIFIIYKNIF